jgi:hypothetical protein
MEKIVAITKRQKWLLIVIAFVLAAIPVTTFLSGQRQDAKKDAVGETVNLSIVPQTNAGDIITPDGTFSREIYIINDTNAPLSAFEIHLSYPVQLLQVTSIDASASPFTTEVFNAFDNTAGTIHIERVNITGTVSAATVLAARVHFRALQLGTADVAFGNALIVANFPGQQPTSLGISSKNGGTYIITTPVSPTPTPSTTQTPTLTPTITSTRTPTPTATNTPTTTPTPSATTTPTITPTSTPLILSIMLSFQGRNYSGANNQISTQISANNTTFSTTATTCSGGTTCAAGEFKINNLSIPGLTTGIPYTVTFKPVGYLERQQQITLVPGTTMLDMRSVVFCAGDVDASGQVNVFDYNELLVNFKKTNVRSDIDGSGVVNALDFSLLLNNWFETPQTASCSV